MTDTLRTRIAKAISDELFVRDAYTEYGTDGEPGQWKRVDGHINLTALADAVILELGQRRCERCRHYTPVDQFPLPYEGSNQMRPFCIPCTDYIEWATS